VPLKNISGAEGADDHVDVCGGIPVELAKHGNLPSIRLA
jgi:hypothetical protein